jgi:hypothetical protein
MCHLRLNYIISNNFKGFNIQFTIANIQSFCELASKSNRNSLKMGKKMSTQLLCLHT